MVDLVYCEPKTKETTNIADIERKKVVICECTGNEIVTFVDEDKIPSYTGELRAPIKAISYYPRKGEYNIKLSDSEIRKWVRDACAYHKIPLVILSLILQNENSANAPEYKKWLQFGERSATTFSNYLDKETIIPIPDIVSKGSTGLANVSDGALIAGVKHSLEKYARPAIPSSVAEDIWGHNYDNQISGFDWRNDLYYAAAHIRYLIDTKLGNCYHGSISSEQLTIILRAYNGPGNASIKYANDAMRNLDNAINKTGVLYFYEK